MPPVFIKEILVEIRHSLGRFCSILGICTIGVAFFAGVKASAPDMKFSADQYFDKYHLQDVQIYSTIGLDDEDLEEISRIPGVETVQPVFSMDALAYKENSELVFKVFNLPSDQKINTVRLIDGRMPENDDECLIEAASVNNSLFDGFSIGEEITLLSGNDEDLSDYLERTTYKIVGTCYTPYYLSYEKGTSAIGSGEVSSFIYVPQADIKASYYTEIDVTIKDAAALNTYSDDYFDLVEPVVKKIEAIADTQVARRIASKQEEVDEAREEFDQKIADGQKELEDARQKLEDAKAEIEDSEKKLADAKAQLDSGWSQYWSSLNQIQTNLPAVNSGIAQINAQLVNLPEYRSQLEQLNQGLEQIQSTRSDLETKQAQVQQALEQIQQAQQALAGIEMQLQNPELKEEEKAGLLEQQAILQQTLAQSPSTEELNGQLGQIQDGLTQLNEQEAPLTENKEQLVSGIAQLEQAQVQLADLQAKKEQMESGLAQLNSSKAQLEQAQSEYDDGVIQLEDGRKELEEGEAELKENEEKFEKEKAKGEKKLADAQKQIDDLDGEWFVLDRNSHYSYRDYGACADRMDGIASVFPVFFFLVAALVCMTTMTRMVDEQRTEIGTLKALGYSKTQIALKYLIYAVLASLIGCILGLCIGLFTFPYIIFYAWNTMYNLETIRYAWQPGLLLSATGSMCGVVLLATFYSIYRELMEVPSQLMRPKASKAGKKILLERIPWIWNRVSFLHKVTIRNIFRYKKRFFMTVIGIAGCTALLVAGFGINDSISDIVNLQFIQIYHYDAAISADVDEASAIEQELKKIPGIEGVYGEETINVTMDMNDKEQNGVVHVIADPQEFTEFTSLKLVSSGEPVEIADEGAYINEKMAQKMNLQVGDSFVMTCSDDETIETKVAGIYENYVGHHIYVSQKQFDQWNVDPDLITESFLVQTSNQSESFEQELGKKIMNLDGIKSVTFYSSLQENFLNMIGSIKMVVVVLVISAAALAFVVLYNLSNVNISERVREIATIKVLGFTEKEVNAYVNRESMILAITGSICGLFIGIYLHQLIMSLAELDDVMFGRTISLQSYIISFVLTILFAAVINFVMKFKLRRIQMVESLKAIE